MSEVPKLAIRKGLVADIRPMETRGRCICTVKKDLPHNYDLCVDFKHRKTAVVVGWAAYAPHDVFTVGLEIAAIGDYLKLKWDPLLWQLLGSGDDERERVRQLLGTNDLEWSNEPYIC